jgi:NADPH2:quinone reductase
MKAIQFARTGGPEVLELTEVAIPTPGPGQILLRHEAIGINYIDTYHRSGLYPVKTPSILGAEAAGRVEAIGEGVTRFKVGDLAAFAGGPPRAYAEYSLTPEGRAARVPASVGAVAAAAAFLKGMTVEMLLHRVRPVRAGETILVHAAAGGVGRIMVQWAKALDVTVIATVGSQEKAAEVRALGADHVILYRDADVAQAVREITGGQGVPVAYDSVGKDTFDGTMKSLGRRGMFVSFGNASGVCPPMTAQDLAQGGSLFFTRPGLFDYIAATDELDASAKALWAMLESGKVAVKVGQTFPLAEARRAHEALEARKTIGASLLIP